jgi:hypothetical protein
VAVHKLNDNDINRSTPQGIVLVDGATIRIAKDAAFETPKASAFLLTLDTHDWPMAVEELLEYGAATAAALQTSAHVFMLEAKVAELTTQLEKTLAEQLKGAGDQSAEVTRRLLDAHKQAITRLLDISSKDGLPAKVVEMLDAANRNAMKHIEVMLQDGEAGAIGKAVKQITEQIKETGLSITTALAARDALLTRSNRRGGRFEEILAVRLPILVRGMGRVEHCANTEGDKARNAGDYLITLDGTHAGEDVTIVVEAKSHNARFSANEIRRELKLGRTNRGARAAVFVAESSVILPDGVGFGQVSDCDFYVAFDPVQGDETSLVCALYLAKATALASVAVNGGEQVDIGAIQREVASMRALVLQFSKIEACHSKVDKEVGNARTVAADLKADIVAALRRLDDLLTP